ncbi:MAG: CRISPR-associated endonuclease Cas1 [Peptococcaceae bacterium]|jgi:CRISPR-associated endonuclease Cas1/CRISPR-associated protein Cas4|nr:CRISPR-associated endonuclease Cas1 [Peptococcaceae bacterium]
MAYCRPPEDELLLPVRMLNEFAYCPRLAYLEWVQGEFTDSADTVEGRWQHRRVDQPRSHQGEKDGETETIQTTSVDLSAPGEGLVAKMDLLETTGTMVTPVDYKRGKRPHIAQGAWEPERVQLCAQGLILRENGFSCDEGVLYFSGSRERVRILFDDGLVSRTRELAAQMQTVMNSDSVPDPLPDSPKCPRCSLVGICLPDEVNFLQEAGGPYTVRPLAPLRDDALPLYVQKPGARLKKVGDTIQVFYDEERLAEARWLETSGIVLFGPVQVSTQIAQEAARRGIPITFLSTGGWFYGLLEGMPHKNVVLRRHQYAWAQDPKACLKLARRFVQAKIGNCRTMLRRNHPQAPPDLLDQMKEYAQRAAKAAGLPELLGLEGNAAHLYFGCFDGMLKNRDGFPFDFNGRNRRPPRDPVNALLSLSYSMLVREWTVALLATGFEPYLGFYHQVRHGRPALALDLMEEFRPLIADSVVLTAVNNGEVRRNDFIERMGSVSLTPEGRARFLAAFERRMNQEISHPVFKYSISYRRVLAVQARLLARHLCGEIPEYPLFVTR